MQDVHAHFYEGTTNSVFNHTHDYSGETSKEPDYHGHIHYISGYTTIDKDHVHYYSITTGPKIEVEKGHIHYYVGYTTMNHQHFHYFSGHTHINDFYKEAKKFFTSQEAKEIGEQLGINWSKFDVEQYRIGLNVELEHGRVNLHTNVSNDDPIMTGKITLAHLNEFPDYYTRLTKMEEEAEDYHEHKLEDKKQEDTQ